MKHSLRFRDGSIYEVEVTIDEAALARNFAAKRKNRADKGTGKLKGSINFGAVKFTMTRTVDKL